MAWPQHRKAETRSRIVTEAAAAFRRDGIENVSVADVMDRAGLTHGGFYAHFPSKDALVAAALHCASEESLAALNVDAARRPERGLQAVADAYLSPGHLSHPERGCPVATLGPEIARGPRPARKALAAGVQARLEQLRRLLPGGTRKEVREQQTVGALACMVGGMVLARILDGDDGARLLEQTRAFLRTALAD